MHLVTALIKETKPARQTQIFRNNEFPFCALIFCSWWASLTKSALIVAGISTAAAAKQSLFLHPLCTRQTGFSLHISFSTCCSDSTKTGGFRKLMNGGGEQARVRASVVMFKARYYEWFHTRGTATDFIFIAWHWQTLTAKSFISS